MSKDRQRILFAGWILFSVFFIAVIAVRNAENIKQTFERASVQQRVNLERTKETAAPLHEVAALTAWAVGIPLCLLGAGAFLIRAARQAA